jgi:hypothetical protein
MEEEIDAGSLLKSSRCAVSRAGPFLNVTRFTLETLAVRPWICTPVNEYLD